jgi:hypothetical protein
MHLLDEQQQTIENRRMLTIEEKKKLPCAYHMNALLLEEHWVGHNEVVLLALHHSHASLLLILEGTEREREGRELAVCLENLAAEWSKVWQTRDNIGRRQKTWSTPR